jgi:2-dehydro-3-deoxyphosphogluconate aldolase/(4S)-4-hydroxy-2-oxoglutarate aldolase
MASMHTASQEAATLDALAATRCTAVVRTGCGETAKGAAEAVIRGGFKSVEFTLSIPNALELIADFSKRPGLLIGAGTVLTVEQAEAVVRAGAHYVVLPCMELSVVKWCAARHVVCMCGVSSPSEMWAAHKAGAHVAKVFPGAAGGPAFVRAVKGPLSFLRIVPTTGVTYENCAEYIQAGAWGVGFTGVLFEADDMANKRFDAIEARARKFSAKVRGPPPHHTYTTPQIDPLKAKL